MVVYNVNMSNMKQGSDQFNYTDGHENKIDPSMFEKDYVLKDDQEQNKPQYKTDNFTEKIGPGPESIKITKNFMTDSEANILETLCNVIYKQKDEDPVIKKMAYNIIEEYKQKILLKAESLFDTSLEYDLLANETHSWNNNLNARPPGFETSVHTDNFDKGHRDYPWSGQISNLIYLNDNYLGGEIYFPQHKLKIKPEKGMLISFPGNWNNRHGIIPASDFRYALSVFLKISDFKVIQIN